MSSSAYKTLFKFIFLLWTQSQHSHLETVIYMSNKKHELICMSIVIEVAYVSSCMCVSMAIVCIDVNKTDYLPSWKSLN